MLGKRVREVQKLWYKLWWTTIVPKISFGQTVKTNSTPFWREKNWKMTYSYKMQKVRIDRVQANRISYGFQNSLNLTKLNFWHVSVRLIFWVTFLSNRPFSIFYSFSFFHFGHFHSPSKLYLKMGHLALRFERQGFT